MMMRRIAGLVLVGLLASAWSLGAQAQWKWRDPAGQIHLSDLPPPGDVPDKDVLQKPDLSRRKLTAAAPVASGASGSIAPSAIDPELQARMKKAEQDKLAQKKQVEEKNAIAKADNCAHAKEHLQTIDSGVRLTRVNAQGEKEFLDDSQRAAEAKRARDVMASDCR